MNQINIAIVEDDGEASKLLSRYLERYGNEKGRDFSVSCFNGAKSFLAGFNSGFDLIFMDIELPDGNGMDVIAKVRETDNDVTVIFVTNMSQYAIQGYEVRAFDFIVKPVSYNNFCVKLTSALDCLRLKKGKDIWISNRDGKTRLHTSQLKYIEVLQHMLIYHTVNGDLKQSGSLKDVQNDLEGEPFALCNRCYLVNLRFVTSVRQFEVLLGDETLQISRLKKSSFMRELNDFLAGGD